jgi:multidrug efflux pump subunit AcrA (membrane-fusion protein)
VYPIQSGVTTKVYVTVDQLVRAGQPLAAITLDEFGTDGSLINQERTQIQLRLTELNTQLTENKLKSRSDERRAKMLVQSLKDQTEKLSEEIALSEQQLVIAKRRIDDDKPLVDKGYISRVEADTRASNR